MTEYRRLGVTNEIYCDATRWKTRWTSTAVVLEEREISWCGGVVGGDDGRTQRRSGRWLRQYVCRNQTTTRSIQYAAG